MTLARRNLFGDFWKVFDDGFFKFYSTDEYIDDMRKELNRRLVKTDKGIDIRINAAGYKKEEITVEIKDEVLYITLAKNDRYGWNEQKYSYTLFSGEHDIENISSSFEDGLLVVSLPMKNIQKSISRKIEIK